MEDTIPIRLLLIEDNLDDALLIQKMLNKAEGPPFTLEVVDCLALGLAHLATSDVDLVLLNISLTNGYGLDTLVILKERTPPVPVVILTSLQEEDLGLKALQQGAQDYLIKDQLDGQLLRRVIRYTLERQQIYKRLHDNEVCLRTIIEHNGDAMLVLNPDGVVWFANQAAEILLARPAATLVGQIFDFLPQASENVEIEIPRPGDEAIVVEAHVEEISWEEKPALLVSLRDITDYRQTEKDLEKPIDRRTAELDLINALNNALIGGVDLRQAVKILVQGLNVLFSIPGGALYLLDKHRQSLVLQHLELPSEIAESFRKMFKLPAPASTISLRPGSLYLKLLQEGRLQQIQDPAMLQQLLTEHNDNPVAHKLVDAIFNVWGLHAVVIVPLLSRGETIGLLHFPSRMPLSASQLGQLQRVVQQFATVLGYKRAEEALRKSEQRYRGLFDRVPVGLYRSTPDRKFLDANPALARMLGYPDVSSLMAADASILYTTPQEQEQWQALMEREGEVRGHEARWRRLDGRDIWVLESTRLFRDDKGDVLYYEGSAEDITARKQAELQRHLLATTLEAIADAITITDREGIVQWVNPAFTTLTGYMAEEVIGRGMRLLKSGLHDKRYYQKLWKAILAGQVWRSEVTNRHKDGSLFQVEQVITPVIGSEGEITHFVAVQRDISERKRVERQILQQLETLRALYAGAQKLAESLDMEEVAQEITRSCVEVFGARLAWLGRAEPDGHVKLLTHFPVESEYPRQISVRWDDSSQGQGPTGRAIRGGYPEVVKDLADDPQFAPWCDAIQKEGFTGSAAFPLISRGRTFGALNVYSDQPDFFVPELVDTFQALANQAAAALENARLFEEVHRHAREIEAAGQIFQSLNAKQNFNEAFPDVIAGLRAITNCARVSIALLDEKGKTFTMLAFDQPRLELEEGVVAPIDQTAAATDILAGRPHFTPDLKAELDFPGERKLYEAGHRSRINLPLLVEGQVMGSLNLAWPYPHGYDETQLPLLEQIAVAVALALEHSRLLTAEQQQRRELETLLDLVTQLRSARGVDELLTLLLHEVRQRLQADTALVALLDQDGQHFTITQAVGSLAPNQGRVFPSDVGISGQVLRTLEAYSCEDYMSHSKALDLIGGAELGPAAFVPMQSEEALLGVLMIGRQHHTPPRVFSDKELRLLVTIGEMAGNNLRRLGLYEAALRRLKRVQALRNIDIAITGSLDSEMTMQVLLDEVIEQLGVDAAALLLLDPETQLLTPAAYRGFRSSLIEKTVFPLGQGYAGRAALERRSLGVENIADDVDVAESALWQEEGLVSHYAAPLIAKERVLGVLQTFHRSPQSSDQEWLEFLEALAGQAALVLENAGLYQELQAYANELEQRVAQRTAELQQAHQDVLQALAREKELNELKTRFVNMVSHEFRTPLTTILSSAELLEHYGQRWRQEKRLKHLQRIAETTLRLTQLLDEVLLVGRAESGHLPCNPEPLDLVAFVRELMEEMRLGLGAQHILLLDLSPLEQANSLPSQMDVQLLRHILTNLLSNAIKYSPAGSPVQLRLARQDDHVIIKVSDQGIGIPAQDQARLFESFHRGRNVGSLPGTGLGLHIVKRLVELHSGTVTVQSEEGQGTTVTVALPLIVPVSSS